MEFHEFAQLMYPAIGGASNTHVFVKTLFDAIITEKGRGVLEEVGEDTYKSYYNGKTGISRMAKKLSPYLEPEEFVVFCNEFQDATRDTLCDKFREYLPEITAHNASELLANLFRDIITEAASSKRKGSQKKSTTANDEFADIRSKSKESDELYEWNIVELSANDKGLLNEFRNDSRDVLLYIINNDPAAEATSISLSDQITEVIQKWQLPYREIENKALRNLMADILKTIDDYTHYISNKFLRYIPDKNVLWFRNETIEEGDRLRDILRPKTYEIRCKIAQLYQRLYPIPKGEEPCENEQPEAEVVDDERPSGAAEGDKKITIIQNQTNVVQNGENNFNLMNNGTMNFNF